MNQKVFWAVLIVIVIFGNENLAQWMLAIWVGNMTVGDGFSDAFKYFTFFGYGFFTLFRLIPYVILALVVKSSIKKGRWATPGIAWGGLLGIALLIFYLSWSSLEPLYTEAHASSTTAIAFIFIPIFAIASGLIGSLIGVGIVFTKNSLIGKPG